MRNFHTLHEPMKVRGEDNYVPKNDTLQNNTINLKNKTIHIMFTFDIKAIRNEYEKLSTLVEKVNNTASEKDLVTRAKSISNEDIRQIYSEQHGGVIDAIMKNTDNAAFIVLLDGAKGKLVLSPYINIKTPNGVVVIVWNIKYDIMTFLPLLK